VIVLFMSLPFVPPAIIPDSPAHVQGPEARANMI